MVAGWIMMVFIGNTFLSQDELFRNNYRMFGMDGIDKFLYLPRFIIILQDNVQENLNKLQKSVQICINMP